MYDCKFVAQREITGHVKLMIQTIALLQDLYYQNTNSILIIRLQMNCPFYQVYKNY